MSIAPLLECTYIQSICIITCVYHMGTGQAVVIGKNMSYWLPQSLYNLQDGVHTYISIYDMTHYMDTGGLW